MGKAERLILETLAQVYPAGLNKEKVAAQAGYEANGGGFNDALGRLRTLERVQGRGELKASENLFDSMTNWRTCISSITHPPRVVKACPAYRESSLVSLMIFCVTLTDLR